MEQSNIRELFELVLGNPFTPGTSFIFNGKQYRRSFLVPNAVRLVESESLRIVEEIPSDKSPTSYLLKDHEPHDTEEGPCDGTRPHQIFRTYSGGGTLLGFLIDGHWRSL